jgi:hypothetical protein
LLPSGIMGSMEPSEIGRALEALRKSAAYTCQRCGREFSAKEPAKYCSGNCRTLAWLKRKRDEAGALATAPPQGING